MNLTNKFDLPAPIVRAVTRDPYDRGPAQFSVSNLIDAPRAQTLQWKFDQKIEEDVSDRIFSLLGRAVHHILEIGADETKETAEERLFMDVEVGGVKVSISGAMDLQDAPIDGVVDITDWKVTSCYGFMADKAAWHKQLNCYAHLVRKAQWRGVQNPDGSWTKVPRHGSDVGYLQIGGILRDWTKSQSERNPEYPRAAIQMLDIPTWKPQEAEDYFLDRVKRHIKARSMDFAGKELPKCNKEERWEDEPKYAVIKPGNKRATAVYEERASADEHIRTSPELELQVRPGEPRRCINNYCKVAEWCSQYEAYRGANNE